MTKCERLERECGDRAIALSKGCPEEVKELVCEGVSTLYFSYACMFNVGDVCDQCQAARANLRDSILFMLYKLSVWNVEGLDG